MASKLDTYEGVFIPTTLNVLSILIYLRFGFIVGQAGILGSIILLLLSYTINLLTTLSISAIATNGIVQGGGAYFMISRSLGAEFGGSIGIVFYIGQVLNAGLNIAGFTDPLLAKFGVTNGSFARKIPDTPQWAFAYETALLFICTAICLKGPEMFARSSKLLFKILIVATVAVPVSTLFVKRYLDTEFEAWYTGPSWATTWKNMFPEFTKGAAGGDLHRKENFKSLFGVFFSATAGVLAGASMSGDLATPSKSIPLGTLWGLALTFTLYALVILSLGVSVSRDLLRRDIDVISSINLSPALVMLGEFSTSIFSALMGIIGAAKLLQAIARDNVVPFIGRFSKGRTSDDNPLAAILVTYFLTQLTILLDVNQIAVYITMALLMTFVVINLACFLLDVASAPNFRPSFHYFNARTAFIGFLVCIAAMLAADILAALTILLLGVLVFIVIHSYAPPKPWGDVSQSIIYHQVRKYLLMLRQDHVKYWRPQILLLVDDPRSGWQLIRFCNYLKKGGLFIMGHVVIISQNFQQEASEIAKQRNSWEKLRGMHRIKAFFQISASPSVVWGVRNVFLGSGLGGMKPNITVLGFYDEHETGQRRDRLDVEALPTDNLRKERHLTVQQWVQMIEDLLTLGSNVCVARGFMDAELPASEPIFSWPPKWKATNPKNEDRLDEKEYIDLYPIQMSARLMDSEGHTNGVSINFDTYTLILQLGSILHSVKAWSTTHELRVVVFVEHHNEVERETKRIAELLDTLRIQAHILVKSLDIDNAIYDIIVKGSEDPSDFVSRKLANSRWWTKLRAARKSGNSNNGGNLEPTSSSQNADSGPSRQTAFVIPRVIGKKRRTLSSLQQFGVAHSIQSTRWDNKDLTNFYGNVTDNSLSSDDESSDGGDDDYDHESSAIVRTEDEDEGEEDHLEEISMPRQRHSSFPTPGKTAPSPSKPIIGASDTEQDGDEAGPSFQDDPMDASDLHVTIRGKCRSPLPSACLAFNDLPGRAQHLILNCLMRKVSRNATVIFTTLPAPSLGTHADEEAARKYYNSLQLLSENLPPIALVNAQSMTVTTDL